MLWDYFSAREQIDFEQKTSFHQEAGQWQPQNITALEEIYMK